MGLRMILLRRHLARFGNAHGPICGTLLHLWLNPPIPALWGTAWRAANFAAPACAGAWHSAGYVMEATAWGSRPWEVFQTGFHRGMATPRRAGSSCGRSRSLVGPGVLVAVLCTHLLRDLGQPSMVQATKAEPLSVAEVQGRFFYPPPEFPSLPAIRPCTVRSKTAEKNFPNQGPLWLHRSSSNWPDAAR